jgi:peptide-methionine (S)-S-oxide reductase
MRVWKYPRDGGNRQRRALPARRNYPPEVGATPLFPETCAPDLMLICTHHGIIRYLYPQGMPTADCMEPKGLWEKATFAAGCFWGVEAAFRRVPGVLETQVGYTGGHTDHPTYEQVCTDRTGHAEAVEVTYDPGRVSYGELLRVFWEIHDPTTPNRQGPDVGSQYRSAIFTHSPEQQRMAGESRADVGRSGRFRRPVVTEIVPAQTFWRAEEYHQRYLEKHGRGACHL